MPISYYAVGSWDDWAEFHLLCLDEATGLYGATIPVRKAPGVEEFQIVENKSWARRFFPVDGGQSIAGPEERHGANWRAEIPCRCRDLHVLWDPVGQRDVKWQFVDHSGKPLGRPVVSRKSATATFFLVGSWNDWQDFLELRPRTRPRTLAAFGGQRDAPHGEDVRKDQIHGGRIPVQGLGSVELQVAQGRDWERRFYPADASTNARVLGPSCPPHGMNWRIPIPSCCWWLRVTWCCNAGGAGALSWTFLDQRANDIDVSQQTARPAIEPEGIKETSALLWRIRGGSESGGVIVRTGPGTDSPQAAARLSTGSVVWELELRGVRLHFRKLRGDGPDEGWISITLNHKVLAEHCSLDEVSAGSLREMCHHSLGCNTRHVKSAFCEADDVELFHALWSELDVSGKYKPPGGGSAKLARMAFVDNRYKTEIDAELAASAFILRTLIATLSVEMVMWWANVYEDGSSGCDFHRDCHFRHNVNVTVSASFGAASDWC
ncbi:unnamed protein product [Symbiodinium microadriaticum]|nr:unnamed protein product [Symbiodinium microadriaticum]